MVFATFLQEAFRTLNWEQEGIRFNGEYLSNLRFADDVALLSYSGDEFQSLITALDKQSRIVGLKINMQKTDVILNGLGTAQPFDIGGGAVEVVSEYIYVGKKVIQDPYHEAEIRRIRMGWSAFGRHSHIINDSVYHCPRRGRCITAASYRYSPTGHKLGGSLNGFDLN